jgi:hypothetical protein
VVILGRLINTSGKNCTQKYTAAVKIAAKIAAENSSKNSSRKFALLI